MKLVNVGDEGGNEKLVKQSVPEKNSLPFLNSLLELQINVG